GNHFSHIIEYRRCRRVLADAHHPGALCGQRIGGRRGRSCRRDAKIVTRLTLCSAKGAPGVTTLACVLGAVWPTHRAVVVAECDPSGGDLAGRFALSTRTG